MRNTTVLRGRCAIEYGKIENDADLSDMLEKNIASEHCLSVTQCASQLSSHWPLTKRSRNPVVNTKILSEARRMSLDDQLELIEALWADIAIRNAVPGPTDAQKAEMDRRLADHEANPDDVVPWDEVKSSALSNIGK